MQHELNANGIVRASRQESRLSFRVPVNCFVFGSAAADIVRVNYGKRYFVALGLSDLLKNWEWKLSDLRAEGEREGLLVCGLRR